MVARVTATPPALSLIGHLRARHGDLLFHQSGGCCDGSSPMCFPAGEFRTGAADALLGVAQLPSPSGGELGPLEFWISTEQFEVWRNTRLIIDAIPGRGGGFSLEAPTGKRFLTRSELCIVPPVESGP